MFHILGKGHVEPTTMIPAARLEPSGILSYPADQSGADVVIIATDAPIAERRELPPQTSKSRVHQLSDGPQRMIGLDPSIKVHIAE